MKPLVEALESRRLMTGDIVNTKYYEQYIELLPPVPGPPPEVFNDMLIGLEPLDYFSDDQLWPLGSYQARDTNPLSYYQNIFPDRDHPILVNLDAIYLSER